MKVCRQYLSFLVVIICTLRAYSLEWIVDDAIYITAPVVTRGDSEPAKNTSSGESQVVDVSRPGKCTKFRDCYPIYFLTDRHDQLEPTAINSALLDFILETSETCAPADTPAPAPPNGTTLYTSFDKADTYVVCPDWSKFPIRTKPLYVTTKQESEDGVFCGAARARADVGTKKPGPQERVVGGRELTPGEAPYAVVMTFNGSQVCGGSLLDEKFVLSAAHCVSHLRSSDLHLLKFFIGDHDIKDPMDAEHQERNVSKVIFHREFSLQTLHDDIAMIELSEPVHYAANVAPVCLSDGLPPFDDGLTFGTLVGWGHSGEKGLKPLTPKTADLRIWKQEDCEEIYEGIAPEEILERAFCAGGFQDGGTSDACRGDSGGPLTINRNNKIQQVGIVSFGIGCGRYPGVFTKVSEYEEWIDKHRSLVVN